MEPIRRLKMFSGGQIDLVIRRMDPQDDLGFHGHEFSELVIVTGGRGRHLAGGGEYPIAAGDAFVVKPGLAHSYQATDRLEIVNVLYDLENLGLPLQHIRGVPGYLALFELEPVYRQAHGFQSRLRLTPPLLERTAALLDQIEGELNASAPGHAFMATGLFMELLCLLSRAYGEMENTDSRALLRLGSAIGHLERQYDRETSVDELAELAHMSRRGFLRSFKRATGLSPIAYLIRLRVAKAAELLRQGQANITEAGFAVGFNDSNYFSRQFRKIMAQSPREFLRRAGSAGRPKNG